MKHPLLIIGIIAIVAIIILLIWYSVIILNEQKEEEKQIEYVYLFYDKTCIGWGKNVSYLQFETVDEYLSVAPLTAWFKTKQVFTFDFSDYNHVSTKHNEFEERYYFIKK